MLTRSGAKLLDFGLAKLMSKPAAQLSSARDSDITAEGMILGTLPYMAPEQVQGNEVDARSDIFSFGALVYEMLAGHKAFGGKNPASCRIHGGFDLERLCLGGRAWRWFLVDEPERFGRQ